MFLSKSVFQPCLLVAALAGGCVDVQSPNSQAFVEWASEHAIVIESLDSSLTQTDVDFLRETFGGARVVGIGESRHDTREQLLVKQVLVKHLVADLGFRALILEESFPHAELLDRYVTTGDGDIRVLMNSLAGWYVWDTEEMLDLVRWIWQINLDRQPGQQVRIFGMDITAPALGVQEVLDKLETAEAEVMLDGASLGLDLQEGDFWPDTWERYSALSDERRTVLSDNYGILNQVLMAQRERLAAAFSENELERLLLLGELGKVGNDFFSSSTREEGGEIRESGMAQTVLWILEHELAGEKAIVWSHNLHVAKSDFRMPGLASGVLTPMGSHLSRSLEEAYISIGGAFGTGSYPENLPPGERLFDDVPEDVMDGALAGVGIPYFFVDLRGARKEPSLSDWLHQEREWKAQDSRALLVPGTAFDFVYYVNVISRSQPTPLALQRFQSLR